VYYYFYYTTYVTQISKKEEFYNTNTLIKAFVIQQQNKVRETHLVFLPQQYQNIHHCTYAQEHRHTARWTGSHRVL
jgi:hypothetical protein